MNYKVGDRVKIKSLDWYNEHKDETDDIECSNNIWFYREMSKFCGKVMTISHVRVDHYTMVEDLVGYWTDEMIERKVEEETKSHNNMCKQLIDEMNPNVEVNVKTKPEPKFKRGDFVFSGIDFCAMKVIDRCYDEHWRYRIFDDVNEYWLFEKELKKVEIGDVVYSKVWKEKVIVRDFCDDKFILVADFNGKLLKSLPSLIKQIKEETKPKPSNTVSVDKAAEVFAEMLVELCPELLGFGGAAKEWENEFRKRLEE